jgi:hypothetical protein
LVPLPVLARELSQAMIVRIDKLITWKEDYRRKVFIGQGKCCFNPPTPERVVS